MELIIAIVIALIVLVVVWKLFKGVIRTFGLLLVLAVVAWFVYSSGGA